MRFSACGTVLFAFQDFYEFALYVAADYIIGVGASGRIVMEDDKEELADLNRLYAKYVVKYSEFSVSFHARRIVNFVTALEVLAA